MPKRDITGLVAREHSQSVDFDCLRALQPALDQPAKFLGVHFAPRQKVHTFPGVIVPTPGSLAADPALAGALEDSRNRRIGSVRAQRGPVISRFGIPTTRECSSPTRGGRRCAERLFKELTVSGYAPWLDRRKLLPGRTGRTRIEDAIASSDFFIACFSRKSVRKERGGRWRSVSRSPCAKGVPLDDVFLIPIKAGRLHRAQPNSAGDAVCRPVSRLGHRVRAHPAHHGAPDPPGRISSHVAS